MAVEFLAVKIFRDEVNASGVVWVARSTFKNIYYIEFERTGVSLPVWSSRQRVEGFLNKARPIGPVYAAHEVPLEIFKSAWLSDNSMAIIELLINPDGSSRRMLALTNNEFQEL